MMITNQQVTGMTNDYFTAAKAYGIAQENNKSGFEIVAELYKGMIRFVGLAKIAYTKGRLDDMCMYIQKVNKILIALQSNLNFEEGGQASVFLNDFYTEIFKRLFKVLRSDNPEAEFDAVHELLKPLSQLWHSHAENAKKAVPDTHVNMPIIKE